MMKWFNQNFERIMAVIIFTAMIGVIGYIGRRHQLADYRATSDSPMVQVDKVGGVFVRTDCTPGEYQSALGSLAKEIGRLQDQIKELEKQKETSNAGARTSN